MAEGVLLFKGMKVGILDGDFTITTDENGGVSSKVILSTAYNVIPVWLRVAHDNFLLAKNSYDELKKNWSEDSDNQRALLIAELAPSMQVIVSCAIAFDALYDLLKPHANLSETLISTWQKNKTGRAVQIATVINRVYKLNNADSKEFRKIISEIIKFRDMAVHPSYELKNSLTRADLNIGVDWKFAVFKYLNAATCIDSTLKLFTYLIEKKCKNERVVKEMVNILEALIELGVLSKKV